MIYNVLLIDVPLLPVIGSKDQQFNFQLHWLNNKELQFTMEAEVILQDMHRGVLNVDGHSEDPQHEASDSDHDDHHVDEVDKSGIKDTIILIDCSNLFPIRFNTTAVKFYALKPMILIENDGKELI